MLLFGSAEAGTAPTSNATLTNNAPQIGRERFIIRLQVQLKSPQDYRVQALPPARVTVKRSIGAAPHDPRANVTSLGSGCVPISRPRCAPPEPLERDSGGGGAGGACRFHHARYTDRRRPSSPPTRRDRERVASVPAHRAPRTHRPPVLDGYLLRCLTGLNRTPRSHMTRRHRRIDAIALGDQGVRRPDRRLPIATHVAKYIGRCWTPRTRAVDALFGHVGCCGVVRRL